MIGRNHAPEDIERGLTTLILAGSSTAAEEQCGIKAVTLRSWKLNHREQYDRLCKDLEPKVVEKIASEAESIVLQLAEIQRGYIARMHETMDELKPGEIPGAMRNAATAAALNIDKLSSPLRERPSHVQQQTDINGIIAQMSRRLGIDATVVENEADNATTSRPLLAESNLSNPRDEEMTRSSGLKGSQDPEAQA